MVLTNAEMKLKKIVCILGIIQGLTWEIMAFICIILYLIAAYLTSAPSSYMESLSFAMYNFFLVNSAKAFDGQVFTKDVFFAFMWFHFALNLLWFGASTYLLRKTTPKGVLLWSYVTLTIAVLDFITFTILGGDYDKCLNWAKDYVTSVGIDDTDQIVIAFEGQCAQVILPVFVIAAKGFTLWIINIVLGVTMWRIGRRMK